MNDFICQQMDYFENSEHHQGYTERLLLKVLNPNRKIELNMVKLDNEGEKVQILFLFKEVSIYNKLQKAKTTEKFTNILINSIAHNLYTPLNSLISLNKGMQETLDTTNLMANNLVHQIGITL